MHGAPKSTPARRAGTAKHEQRAPGGYVVYRRPARGHCCIRIDGSQARPVCGCRPPWGDAGSSLVESRFVGCFIREKRILLAGSDQ